MIVKAGGEILAHTSWIRGLGYLGDNNRHSNYIRMSVMYLKQWVSTSVTPECLSRMSVVVHTKTL